MEQIQKKTVPNRWGIWDYPLLIEYLENMALEGWLLECYHEKTLEFVPIEPKAVKYAVTFFKEYNADGFTPPENLVYMWQVCETDGWKNITHNNYIQIFYNENPDVQPFHTDAVVQLYNFNGMIESSLMQKWKYRAYLMAIFIVFYCGIRIPRGAASLAHKGDIHTYMVFLAILGVFFLYELFFSLFRWHKHRQWYRIAQVYAEDDNIFMPPFDNPVYDKVNFVVTVVFCLCFGGAVLILGVDSNIFGTEGVLIALEAVYIFIMSRILVSLKIERLSDDGYIVPIKDKYPCTTAMFILGAVLVVWMIGYNGWTPNIF